VRRPTSLALALATAAALAGAPARGGPRDVAGGSGSSNGNGRNGGVAAAAEPVKPRHLRLALSPAAGAFMTEVRVRSLLRVELAGELPLADEPTGPIDENAVRAWIDLPDEASVLIQVQAPGRVLTRRRLDVTGLQWDVAARFTALATAELVRAHLTPLRVRRPRPRVPTADEIDRADRARPRWVVAAGAHAHLGGGPPTLGPELELGHATRVVDVRLQARLVGGDADQQRVQAGELGLSALHRLHATPWLRAELGASFAVGSASMIEVTPTRSLEGDAAGHGRLGARLGLGARVIDQTWLGLRVEPDVIVGGPAQRDGDRPLAGGGVAVVLGISRDVPIGEAVP
jgi:hypothetical protein